MDAGQTRQRCASPTVTRGLAGTIAAFALLVQALFAAPLALRMAADVVRSAELGAVICLAGDDGSTAGAHQAPLPNAPSHGHAQCAICQGHAPLPALIALVLVLLAVPFLRARGGPLPVVGPPRQRGACHGYLSQGPPIFA